MTEAGSMFGAEHVRRYRETNGEVGHICNGATDLLLTTKGGSSGGPRTTPVAYDRVGDDFLVLASNGGARAHPGRCRSLAQSRSTCKWCATSSTRMLGPRPAPSGSARGRSVLDNTPTGRGARR
jgi:hypothetical protein